MQVTKTPAGYRFNGNVDTARPGEVFEALSEVHGKPVAGVKVRGFWALYVDGVPASGFPQRGQARHRKLSAALADGLGVAIAMTI